MQKFLDSKLNKTQDLFRLFKEGQERNGCYLLLFLPLFTSLNEPTQKTLLIMVLNAMNFKECYC